MSFCLDDGVELLYGPAGNELATAILPRTPATSDEEDAEGAPTKPQIGPGSFSNSIAVLPFANMGADAENEYFCDGLAEELLNALTKIENLKVAARTASFSFRGKHAQMSEIGRALNVSTILEGIERYEEMPAMRPRV